jgi:hypothetical protein
MKCSAAARKPLEREHRSDTGEQQRAELRRSDWIAEREPGAKNSGRKRVYAEVGHRAVVGERFHQAKRRSGGDARPRERQ